jgi:hypothetical protein
VTEFERISLGEYCEDLLQQESFNTLVRLHETQSMQDLLNTGLLEKNKREAIYAAFHGFKEFLGLMKACVDVKDGLLKSNEQAPSEDTDALPVDIEE